MLVICFSEYWLFALLSHIFSSFLFSSCHRAVQNNALTGPIPSEISMLTKLGSLYAANLIKIIECWSCILLSVGHVCLLSAFQTEVDAILDQTRSCYYVRNLGDWSGGNKLTGTIPSQISALVNLESL